MVLVRNGDVGVQPAKEEQLLTMHVGEVQDNGLVAVVITGIGGDELASVHCLHLVALPGVLASVVKHFRMVTRSLPYAHARRWRSPTRASRLA